MAVIPKIGANVKHLRNKNPFYQNLKKSKVRSKNQKNFSAQNDIWQCIKKLFKYCVISFAMLLSEKRWL